MTGLLGKKTVFSTLIGLLFVINIGGFFTAGMMMGDGMMKNDCPFMGVPALCTMSPLQHIAQWQQMFTTTGAQTALSLFLLLISLAVISRFLQDWLLPKRRETVIPRYRVRPRVFDPLQLAFARGVLHSKAY